MTIISYAQNREDVMLWRALGQQPAGFYIDVGAADPSYHSVTKLFYDAGWRGINIEPVPDYARRLRAYRERDINLEVAAGAKPGRMTLHHVTGTGLSTLHSDLAARAADANYLSTPLEVEVLTLSEICRQHAPADVHFLKIDVEGAEKAVLEGMDLRAHNRPWIVVVEATEPLSQTPSYEDWDPLLIAADYSFVWFDGLNRFYVAAERVATLGHAFTAPPNVFDDFISVAEFDLHARLAATEEAARNQACQAKAQMAEEKARSEELARKLSEEGARAAESAIQLSEVRTRSDELARALGEERARSAESARELSELQAHSDELARALGEERIRSAESARRLGEERARSAESARRLSEERTRFAERAGELSEAKQRLKEIKRSISWRVTGPLRALDRVLKRWLPGFRISLRGKMALFLGARRDNVDVRPEITGTDRYQLWIAENESNATGLLTRPGRPSGTPFIAFLVNAATVVGDATRLQRTLASLVAQTDGDWECLVAAPLDNATDARIRFLPCFAEPGACLNGLVAAATAPFVSMVDPGDVVAPTAVAAARAALVVTPDLDLIYGDEDVIEPDGTRRDPAFKPSWSPELLLSYNYIGRLAVLKRSVIEALDGFDSALGRAAEWDLNLRITEATQRVGRITKVLYHRAAGALNPRPGPAEPDAPAFREALRRQWARWGCDATITTRPDGTLSATWTVADPPLVSIIVPNKDKPDLLRVCLEGLLHGTAYTRREIIIVDNDSTSAGTLSLYKEIRARPDARVVPFLEPFNYSAACNAGARAARGELLLFLNNDIEVTDPGWLDELVRWAVRPGVGIVGTKLVYPDGRLQHAGVVVGMHLCGLIFRAVAQDIWGVYGSPDTLRNYLAIMGACQMVRRDVFNEVGGFDETYRISNSDVALCLHAWKKGWRTVYTPFAQLTHHEGATRGHTNPEEDLARTAADIRALGLETDPFFHPALSPQLPIPTLRLAPDVDSAANAQADIAQRLSAYQKTAPLDLFDDAAMREVISPTNEALQVIRQLPDRIDDRWSAACFCIALLRKDSVLRARFPRALSEGINGDFAAWLHREASARFGFSPEALGALKAALRDSPGAPVRQVCLMRPDILATFPLGFTPAGRRGLLTWLFRHGVPEHGFRPEQIWWFALECAEDPARELLLTWHMTPAWQRMFPEAPTRFGHERFAGWLAAMYNLSEDWATPDAWPEDLSPAQQLRIAWQLRPGWQRRFPDALDRQESARQFHVWLGSEDAGLAPGVRAWCRSLDPVVTGGALAAPGLNIIGHFAYPSGLRTSVESLVEGLSRAGIQVSLRDVPVDRRKDEPIHAHFTGLEEFPVTLVHVQPEPFFLQAHEMAGLFPRARRGYRIGYWYWEMDSVPASWDSAALDVDELWVATRFVANALKARYDLPVFTLPPGVELAPFTPRPRASFGIPEDRFAFLFVFHMMSIMERKNPIGLIRAFSRAFRRDESAVLVLKTTFGENHPALIGELRKAAKEADAEVIVIDQIYTQAETLALMDACDAYVSLHRSEGLGLTMAEAMLLAKPVIATGFSGNVDFMNERNSLLVDYRVVPIGKSIPPYEAEMRWAVPSEEHAAALMRQLFEDRAFAAALGNRARHDLRRNYNIASAGRRMADRLAKLREERLGSGGQ